MQTMQSNLFYCKITLHVSGDTAPIIRTAKTCNRSLYRRLRLQFLALLMIGAVTLETCRVILQWNKLDCIVCITLDFYSYRLMMHGIMSLKNVYFISAHQTPAGYKRGKQNLSRKATKNGQPSLKTNEISRPTSKPSFISHVKAYQNDYHTTFQSRPSNATQFKDQTYIVCVKNAGSAHQSDKGTPLTQLHQPTYHTVIHTVL